MIRTHSHIKKGVIAFLALILLSCVPVSAQYRRNSVGLDGDNYHFGYISGIIGYSMLDTRATDVLPVGSLGGGIGAGYEFRNSGFWTNVGVQFSFHRSQLQLDPYTVDYEGFDTQGKAATLHYRVSQTDEINWNFLDIPILFGYYTHGFHLGAGLKLSYAIHPTTHTTGSYNLSATNHEYNVTFRDMPDKGYTDYSFNSTYDNRLNIGASLIGEIGYDLLSSMPSRSRVCHVAKLSFYFEYGLNNLAKGWDTPQQAIVPNRADATKAVVYPYMNTFGTPNRTVPFFAGAKLTYMIGGSRTARSGFHHGCMCYQ